MDYNGLNAAIKVCEEIIIRFGGTLITERMGKETWVMNKEKCITEQVSKRVYRFRDSYVCVDKLYFL